MTILSASKDFNAFFNNNYSEFDAAENITTVGNGLYNVLFMISCFGLVLGIGLICISLMYGNSAQRSEGKKQLVSTLITGVILFCVGGIVQILLNISGTFKF